MAGRDDFAGGTNTFGGFQWPKQPNPQMTLDLDYDPFEDDEPLACGVEDVDQCEACT